MKQWILLAGLLMMGCEVACAATVPVISPPLAAATPRPGAAVGFVVHPYEAYYDQLTYTPAAAELSNIFAWQLQAPTPTAANQIVVNFTMPTNWLRQVYSAGRMAYPILDTSIQNATQSWLVTLCGNAGQNLVGADGQTRAWCSFFSPLYREAVLSYVDQLIDWVKVNDHAMRVPGYTNGAEWFWPAGTMDYSPLALTAWQDWLKLRYHNSLAELNAAWGSALASWSAAAPPRSSGLGGYDVGLRTFSINGNGYDIAWATAPLAMHSTTTYTASVQLSAQNYPEGMAQIQIAWLNTSNTLLRTDNFAADETSPNKIIASAAPPTGATQVQLLLKLLAPGKVTYTAPTLLDSNGVALTPPGVDAWWFAQWAGAGTGQSALDGTKSTFTIEIAAPAMPYTYTAVALEDWVNFSYEAMAGWLNETSRHVRQRDPSRSVSSYVGFVFGSVCMWDLAMEEQRLDISLANTPDVDVNGIQLCVAGEDFTYATGPLDIARKYGKTLRATDLIDFPWGLYSGFAPIYRGALAGVQHGMRETFFYNWYGTPDYAFFSLMNSANRALLLNGVQKAIVAVRDYKIKTDVAQLLPLMSYSLADEGGYKGDQLDAGGFYRLVLDSGLSPDIWTPYEIEKQGVNGLSKYRALLISDCPVLPSVVNAALLDYVSQGGVIIGEGRPPEKDLQGKALATKLVAHELPLYSATMGKGKILWTNDKLGRAYWGKVRRHSYYGNTPPVFIEEPDINRTPQVQQTLRERLQGMLTTTGIEQPVRLNASDAGINLALYQRPYSNSWIVFVVRHGAAAKASGVRLTLKMPFEIQSLAARPDLEDNAQTLTLAENGILTLPDFEHACLVEIQGPALGIHAATAWLKNCPE